MTSGSWMRLMIFISQPHRGQLRGSTSQIFLMSSRQVLDGTRRRWCSDTSSTVASGWPSGDAGSSPGLKTPALILSPPFLLEYQA